MEEPTRVDRWLWAVRLCPSRTAATSACQGGHVRVNGRPAKPATKVTVGDRVAARVGGRDREVEVVRVIGRRVEAPIAVECYVDHSPPPPAKDEWATWGGARPTKRDRRRLDRWRGR